MDYNRFVERMRMVYPEHRRLFDLVEKENAEFNASARSIDQDAPKRYRIVSGEVRQKREAVTV